MGYFILFLIVVLIALVVFFRTPVGKGIIGEKVIQILIGKNNPKKLLFSIHDLTFHDGTKSVQIDHIVINPYGIHVIETKNYGGRIYGDEQQSNWTQVLAYGKVKNKLYNPIKQNAGHIYSLRKVLVRKANMYSYVVFTGRAELRVKAKQTPVVYPLGLKRAMRKATIRQQPMQSQEVHAIYHELLDMKSQNTITKKEHIAGIRDRQKQRSKQTRYRK